jgi:RNA polymerase sigma-70 factor (ECF subfamily)
MRHEGMDVTSREAELVSRAVRGDQVALTMLLTQSRPELVRYVAERLPADVRGAVDTDDIVQQTHVDVFRKFAEFQDRGTGSFARWMATIALRRLRDAIRRQRAAKRGGGAAQVPSGAAPLEDSLIALLDWVQAPGRSPSRSIARREAIAAVQTALDELPPDYREALWRVNVEGIGVAATAQAMGRSERAIHNLCYKARNRLRELLGARDRYLSSHG